MKYLALTLALLCASCTTVKLEPENPRKVWCDFNSPRAPLAVTDTTPRSVIDEHNSYQDQGIEWCKWKVRQ